MPCDIFDKLVGEDGMSAVDKFHGPFEEGTYVYPIRSSNHFTLSVLDLSKSRSRFATIDSLSWLEDYIRNAWEIFFKKRNLPKLSIATLDGGRQLQNDSECGAFTLLNMDALVKEAPFFDIKSWNQEALARNCQPGGTCQVAREQDLRCEENAFGHNSLIRACKLPVNPSKSFGAAAAFSAAAEKPSTLSL